MKPETLIELGKLVRCASIINLDTRTVVKLTGFDNPHQGSITKLVRNVRGILLQRTDGYHQLVLKRMTIEGIPHSEYEPCSRSWGKHIPGTPLILHNREYYLQVLTFGCGEVQYLCNGKPITEVDGVMYDRHGYIISGIPVSTNAHQGGIENKVVVRSYKAKSIVEVRAFNEIWK